MVLDPDFLHLKLGLDSWGNEGTYNTFLALASILGCSYGFSTVVPCFPTQR